MSNILFTTRNIISTMALTMRKVCSLKITMGGRRARVKKIYEKLKELLAAGFYIRIEFDKFEYHQLEYCQIFDFFDRFFFHFLDFF